MLVGRVAGDRRGGPRAAWSGATARTPLAEHFRSFDTICSATQERQDAVLALLRGAARRDGGGRRVQLQQHLPPGGAGAVAGRPHLPHRGRRRRWIPTTGAIRHQPIGTKHEDDDGRTGWAPSRIIGITAGASTPNNKVGETIARICALAGVARGAARPDRVSRHRMAFLDLSHTIEHGMTTYPGLPGPIICDYLSREASRERYAPGVEFQIGKIEMVANTGTYLDAPFHRYADGKDLSAAAARIAGRPRRGGGPRSRRARPGDRPRRVRGARAARQGGAGAHRLGRALGHAERYLEGNPFLTAEAAEYLRRAGAPRWSGSTRSTSTTLGDLARPVHSILLGAEIPIVGAPVPISGRCPSRASASRPCRPRSPGSGPGRSRLRDAVALPCLPSDHRLRLSRHRASLRRARGRRGPGLGMKLTNLRRLAGGSGFGATTRSRSRRRVPAPRTSRRPTAAAGTSAFRRSGPSVLPGAPAGTPPLPDHGELWSAPWSSSVYEHADGNDARGTARGERLPYEFQREVTLARHAPVVRLRYRLRHTVTTPFPWIWSAHPLLNVQPGTTLALPGVHQVKLDAVHGGRPEPRTTW